MRGSSNLPCLVGAAANVTSHVPPEATSSPPFSSLPSLRRPSSTLIAQEGERRSERIRRRPRCSLISGKNGKGDWKTSIKRISESNEGRSEVRNPDSAVAPSRGCLSDTSLPEARGAVSTRDRVFAWRRGGAEERLLRAPLRTGGEPGSRARPGGRRAGEPGGWQRERPSALICHCRAPPHGRPSWTGPWERGGKKAQSQEAAGSAGARSSSGQEDSEGTDTTASEEELDDLHNRNRMGGPQRWPREARKDSRAAAPKYFSLRNLCSKTEETQGA